jgi:hypothetical protein
VLRQVADDGTASAETVAGRRLWDHGNCASSAEASVHLALVHERRHDDDSAGEWWRRAQRPDGTFDLLMAGARLATFGDTAGARRCWELGAEDPTVADWAASRLDWLSTTGDLSSRA